MLNNSWIRAILSIFFFNNSFISKMNLFWECVSSRSRFLFDLLFQEFSWLNEISNNGVYLLINSLN